MKISICKLKLDIPLKRSDIRAFRSDVSAAVGEGHVLFHGHTENGDAPLRYRYPLIQYKVQDGHAAIVGLAEGAKELRQFIDADGELFAGRFPIAARVDENHLLGLTDDMQPYYLAQWLALNQHNHERWLCLNTTTAQTAELERILAAHLLSFAAGVGFDVPRPRGLVVEIHEFAGPRKASYHGVKFGSFDVRFSANINLPFDMGIGKSASHGFGCVWKPKRFIPKMARKQSDQFAFEW